MTWHDFRRTAGSLLLSRGVNLPYVSNFLGHANPNVTLRVYAKLLDAADQDERVTAILGEAVMERDLENGGGEQAQTPKPRDAANVRVLAKTVGGGDR